MNLKAKPDTVTSANNVDKRLFLQTYLDKDISYRFKEAKLISKLDALHGDWAIQLDESSSKFATFVSLFGRERDRPFSGRKTITSVNKFIIDSEKRDANIDREPLALDRLHTYIFGRLVTILSDHKSLKILQHKNLTKAPPRLQRMLLRFQPITA
ncbi:hypothetical protein RRG08_046489 [Elysia crispata]|uniref:Reverse transcriptase RNase H-like domain-containing protein n=1 Tax=Elysia crispata TaxID=231223 RepID=A0AAE0YIR7_9GAST|nr:hypothetical protein RRG08_046489 [Elysia crispata]